MTRLMDVFNRIEVLERQVNELQVRCMALPKADTIRADVMKLLGPLPVEPDQRFQIVAWAGVRQSVAAVPPPGCPAIQALGWSEQELIRKGFDMSEVKPLYMEIEK